MIDFIGNRSGESYIYREVDRLTFQEGEQYADVLTGSVELAAFTAYHAAGKMEFSGRSAPKDGGLVRIYYSFSDDGGNEETFPLGTFLVSVSDVTETPEYSWNDGTLELVGANVSGNATLTGLLKIADADGPGYPYTVDAGTFAVGKAAYILEGMRLRVNVADESGYTLAGAHTFDAKDSWLDIVNWLLDAAGYQSAYTDAFGTVQLARSVDPANRVPAFNFVPGKNSIMLPDVSVKRDSGDTPNCVRLSYDTDKLSMWAASMCHGPDDDIRSIRESVSEIDGADDAEMLDALKAAAEKKLTDNLSEIEYVEIVHPYIPIYANDAITVNSAGTVRTVTVTNMDISLKPGTQCKTKARRFIRPSVPITTEGAVTWTEQA